MFGMPRWLWFVMLGVGIAGGLYFRHRAAQNAAAATDSSSTDGQDSGSDSYYDPSADPSLAGQGVYPDSGGGGGSYYPGSNSDEQVTRDLFTGFFRQLTRLERQEAQRLRGIERGIRRGARRPHPHPQGSPPPHKPEHGHHRKPHPGQKVTGGGPPRVGPHAHMPVRTRPAHRQ